MATYQSIIDRMEELATGVAGDASVSPLADSEMTAYTLLPHLIRHVVRDRANKGRVDDIVQEFSIALDADGEGTLPDTVLREHLPQHASMPAYQFASYLPYPDYGRYKYTNQLTYFSVRGGTFYCSKDPSTTVILRTPALVEVSADIDMDDDVELSAGVVDDIIAIGAAVLRGEISLSAIADGYQPQKR